jgi:ion channel-forming bestrophin family protein
MSDSLWFKIIFDFHKTKTLKKLSISVLLVGLYAFACDYLESEVFHVDFKPPSYIFSMLGIVLGLLLVFRTNTAYDRWWEGRKLLSKLGYNLKNLSIKVGSYLPKYDEENRTYFYKMMVNHAFSLKETLRDRDGFDELIGLDAEFIESLKTKYHVPNHFIVLINERIVHLYRNGTFTDMQFLELSKHIDEASEVVSSCERIHTSPIPFSYSIHLKKFLLFFTIILPFGFIHDLGYWCILIVMLVFYAMTGLETIGEEIEDPFGQDENDLPFDSVCKSLKKSLAEILETK